MRVTRVVAVGLERTLVAVALVGALLVAGSIAHGPAGAAPSRGRMPAAPVVRAASAGTSASVLAPACGQCGGSGGNLSNELLGVSCTSSTSCVAVGSTGNPAGQAQALIESWNGDFWSVVPSPSPSDSYSVLRGVSCSSSTTCVAVGSTVDPAGPMRTLVEVGNGNGWSIVPSPNPMRVSELDGISCTGPTTCTAVGTYGDGTAQLTLVESWNGSTWSVVPSPSPTSVGTSLRGVSCASATACVAVGSYDFDSAHPEQTLVESWNGSTWSVVPSPSPMAVSELDGISCTSSTSCMAVGTQNDVTWSRPNTLHESWDGTTWTVAPSPTIGSDNQTQVLVNVAYGVSCASPTDCLTVGNIVIAPVSVPGPTFSYPLVESWDGSSWSSRSSPTPVDAGAIYATILNGVSCLAGSNCVAVGDYSNASGTQTLITSWNGSEWSVVPSPNVRTLVPPSVAMAAMPAGNGYWIVDAAGDVTTHGAAINYGSTVGRLINAPIVQIVSTPDGQGYWLVAADGGVFCFGDAVFSGSAGNVRLNAPVVGLAPTPTGTGYRLVAADGGVFAFGDAEFNGSMGGHHLNQPVVGMATDSATGGYWLVAADGGVFAFGAPFLGSTGAAALNQPVVAMASSSDGGGYWLAAGDGGVFAFGDATFHGSMGGVTLNAPVAGMAADDATGGYWLAGVDGGVFSFDAPFLGAG